MTSDDIRRLRELQRKRNEARRPKTWNEACKKFEIALVKHAEELLDAAEMREHYRKQAEWSPGSQVFSELDKQIMEVRALRAEIKWLREVLRMDQPRTLRHVLDTLSQATTHLLIDHDCDAHGYENVQLANEAAKEIIVALDRAQKSEGK